MADIKFERRIIDNGLTVIVHQDSSSAMAAVNLLYRVGARNEDPSFTGLAHLTEHLMFSGSAAVPSFDAPLQRAAAENNAFTNNDYTNYYIALPAANIETALFVESDRMANLTLGQDAVDVQKKVVIEEFAQRYTNQPYGDVWHILRQMCYRENHPYSWPTIGKSSDDIQKVLALDARRFYHQYYTPDNAVLSIASPYSCDHIFRLVDKWFALIPPRVSRATAPEFGAVQYINAHRVVERDVAASVIYICFAVGGRTSDQVAVLDVATDLLSGGESSRMVQQLVKGSALFSSVNCYITAEQGPGLLVATGRLMDGVSPEQGQEAMWAQLRQIAQGDIDGRELQKVRNKFEANTFFSHLNSLNKAMNLAYYEFLGSAEMINSAIATHGSIDGDRISAVCDSLFQPQHATTLHYLKR